MQKLLPNPRATVSEPLDLNVHLKEVLGDSVICAHRRAAVVGVFLPVKTPCSLCGPPIPARPGVPLESLLPSLLL